MESQKTIGYTVTLMIMCTSFICCRNNTQQILTNREGYKTMVTRSAATPEDIAQRFPKNAEQIKRQAQWAMDLARTGVAAIINLSPEQRTFDNTVRAYDVVHNALREYMGILAVLRMLSPDGALRTIAQTESLALQSSSIDLFMNPALYKAFEGYKAGNRQQESLSPQEAYFLDDVINDFKRSGMHLPDAKLARVKTLNKEISQITTKFEANIANDKSFIRVPRTELAGLADDFIGSLKHNADNTITVTCDYPTYFEVMENCIVESTRKALYYAFQNRSYPANISLLNNLTSLRDQLAKELGFSSFAALSIDDEMASNPQNVELFIGDLVEKGKIKASQEFEQLQDDLPDGVTLTTNNKFKPWDVAFAKESYKKSHFQLDQRAVAEYFPVDTTLQGMLEIYQSFLGVTFKQVTPAWSWHNDVQMIAIYDTDTNQLRGHLFLDLYPRENKYSHACHLGFIGGQQSDIVSRPSVAVVVANFPKATSSRPALLKHNDVTTFFHEFGHAMHYALGHTEMLSHAGTAVKRDFVEMPSQMFEEWMFDKGMLKKVSRHYKTGQPLPDAMIDTLIALKKFDSGAFIVRQCFLSLFALKIYQQKNTDTDALLKRLHEEHILHSSYAEGTHFQAAFGHLTNYGACYYSYMWSKVFALDIFDYVKRAGLLKPETGRAFVEEILSKGGSDDPQNLLQNFLGRKPRPDAFYKDLGL